MNKSKYEKQKNNENMKLWIFYQAFVLMITKNLGKVFQPQFECKTE